MSVEEKEADVQTFSNNDLTVVSTKKSHCRVKFDITVNESAVEAAYQKALKKVSKEVSVPGFRKGKAPNHFIIEKYGSAIKEEFVDIVLQTAFNEALHLTNLHPLKDSLKRPVIKECSKGKPAHFIIEFESRLSIPEVNFQDLKVKKIPEPHITSEDVQKAIQQLLTRLAEFTPVTDRPVKENDFIDLDVVLFGNLPKSIDNERIPVKKDHLPDWLIQKIIGLRVGETVEGQTESSHELTEDNAISAQPVPFKATVKQIWEAHIPELTDELAQKVGVQTVQELEEKMKERLEKTAQEDAFENQAELIEQALLSSYDLDIPYSYLESEKKSYLDGYLRTLLKKNLGDYIENNRVAIEQEIEKLSLLRLKIYFILHGIAIANDISPSQEDIMQEFARQQALMTIGRGRITANSREQLENQLHNLALEQKIKQFLIDQVTLVDD